MIHLIWLAPLTTVEKEQRASTFFAFEVDLTIEALREAVRADAWIDGAKLITRQESRNPPRYVILERRTVSFRGAKVERMEATVAGVYREGTAAERALLLARGNGQ